MAPKGSTKSAPANRQSKPRASAAKVKSGKYSNDADQDGDEIEDDEGDDAGDGEDPMR